MSPSSQSITKSTPNNQDTSGLIHPYSTWTHGWSNQFNMNVIISVPRNWIPVRALLIGSRSGLVGIGNKNVGAFRDTTSRSCSSVSASFKPTPRQPPAPRALKAGGTAPHRRLRPRPAPSTGEAGRVVSSGSGLHVTPGFNDWNRIHLYTCSGSSSHVNRTNYMIK